MPNFMTFSRDRLVVLAECIRREAQGQRPKSSVPSPAYQVQRPSQVQRSAIPRGGRPLVLAARMVSFALVESRSPSPLAAFLHRDPAQTLQANLTCRLSRRTRI